MRSKSDKTEWASGGAPGNDLNCQVPLSRPFQSSQESRALQGWAGVPKSAAPNRGHRAAALQDSMDISLEKQEQLSGWLGREGGRRGRDDQKKEKRGGKSALC